MPDIHIEREHSLGLPRARELASKWIEAAESRLQMACTYEEGQASDLVSFTRPGVKGELRVTRDRFELHARLGLLVGAFKTRIVNEIERNLDELLRQDDPVAAFEQGLARATAKKARPAATAPARSRKA